VAAKTIEQLVARAIRLYEQEPWYPSVLRSTRLLATANATTWGDRGFLDQRHRTAITEGAITGGIDMLAIRANRDAFGAAPRAAVSAIVFKLCQSASKKWRRLDGSHHLAEIIRGVKFKDGEKLIERAA
jgi:hypothetical protein